MDQRILFRLTSTHLIVANTGKPFSKEGLKSIVYPYDSAKTSHKETFPDSEKQAQDYISEIIDKKCNTFKDIDELVSARGRDRSTAGDYSERLLLELLQNAIDAGGYEQIGNKGIGFRSVLNGVNIIEIHSGFFHVRWSDEDAKNTLIRNQINIEYRKPPLLALPTWCKEKDAEVRTLLNEGYDTVIRLTLTEHGKNYVKEEWERFSNDPSILLFIKNRIEVLWDQSGRSKIQWLKNQDHEKKIISIEIKNGGFPSETKYWRRFESEEAIAAYKVDNDLLFQKNTNKDETPLLYSFFPAALSPHPFPNLYLHHSEFDLQSNRQAVNIDERCLKDLSEVIMMAASSMENETDFLDLLQVNSSIPKVIISTPHQHKKNEIKIWERVRPELAKKKFKGLGDRRLSDIKSCPKNEDMPYSMRNENRWKIWEAFLSALKITRPNSLFDLPVLQPGTENKQREETLLKFNTNSPFGKKEIKEQTWAPVQSSNHAVDSSKVKIFLPCKGEILHSPDDIEVRFLTSNFLEAFESLDANAIPFLIKVLGVHEFSAIGVIEHCVLPVLEKAHNQEASKKLILFLKSLREADVKEAKTSVETFDWENAIRCDLVRNLFLKCQEKIWPVLHVYADQKWTGSKFLEHTYGATRGFIEMKPPEDLKERASWENFWKWLGVGWCPKIMPLLDDVVSKLEDYGGLKWNEREKIFQGTFFQRDEIPDNWHMYCNALLERTSSIPNSDINSILNRTPRIKKNWTIDGGLQLLKKTGAFHIVGSNWSAYEKWMGTMISYSSNKQYDYDNRQTYKNHNFPSYLLWLIQTISWIPCVDGSYHEGYRVFLKNSPVAKKIPQFVTVLRIPECDERQEKDSLPEGFIRKCGIRSGWKDVKDSDWKSWLKKASEMEVKGEKNNINREAIHLIYRSLIDHRKTDEGNQWKKQPVKPIKNIPLWGIEYPGSIDENWYLCNPASPPYFVDRGDLADMGLPGLYLFPVRLDGLFKKVSTHFGLSPLSDVLKGSPLDDGDLFPKFTLKAKERINELVAYLRMDNKKYSDEELIKQINSLSVKQVNGLKVKFSIHGSDLGGPIYQVKFCRKNQDNSWTIFFDESGCSGAERWEIFAQTLLLSCGFDMDKEANVRDLLQYSSDELHGRMLRLGVAPETIEDLKRKKENDKIHDEIKRPPHQEESDGAPDLLNHPVTPSVQPSTKGVDWDSTKNSTGNNVYHTKGGKREEIKSNNEFDGKEKNNKAQIVPSPSRSHPEEGMKAQKWLFGKIINWCKLKGIDHPIWERDFVDITVPFKPPLLIEAKRIERPTVHWSNNQIQKAISTKNIYTIALLRPHANHAYEVFWVIDPIKTLKRLSDRHIEWIWRLKKGSDFEPRSWEKPGPPPVKEADTFNAVISFTDDWIETLPKGVEDGLNLISQSIQ